VMRKFSLSSKLRELFAASNTEFYDELEDILIEGDIGPATAARIVETLRGQMRGTGNRDRDRLYGLLRSQLGATLRVEPLSLIGNTTNLLLILGVNGVGKTTTIAKLAQFFRKERGKTVLLAAADTFRAAAIDQLVLWGERIGVTVIRQNPGADPGAVVFDAISSAEANRTDLVLADTAGRMHNKAHLVKELGKINRIASNRISGSAYKKILVLDATTGQNALRQAEVFQESVGVDSIIMAKYDSTAKGGIVVAISSDLGIPISFMGVGEKVENLVPFDKELYLNGLIGTP
jgi:fused signal recognition particle receptor